MMRWTRRVILALMAAAALSYLGDWAVYKLRGSPTAKMMVSHFVSAPLKNNKQEIDYLGSEDMSCAMTMYPQDGMDPCWYLRRHTNQVKTY